MANQEWAAFVHVPDDEDPQGRREAAVEMWRLSATSAGHTPQAEEPVARLVESNFTEWTDEETGETYKTPRYAWRVTGLATAGQ